MSSHAEPPASAGSSPLERQRQRARDAQRRLRSRRQQAVWELEERIKVLEHCIDTLLGSFARFSDQISTAIDMHGDNTTVLLFRNTLKTFAETATLAGIEPLEDPTEVFVGPVRKNQDAGTEIHAAESSTARHQLAASPIPISPGALEDLLTVNSHRNDRRGKACDINTRTNLPVGLAASASPSIQLMVTNNPLFTEDYWSLDDLNISQLPLWQRLFQSTMIVSHKYLNVLHKNGASSGQWLSRAHRFSLPRSSPLALINLTAIGLRIAAMESQEQSSSEREQPGVSDEGSVSPNLGRGSPSSARYFDVERYRSLAAIVKEDMIAQGIALDDMVNAEGVEDYLGNNGMVGYDKQNIYMRLTPESPWCAQLAPTGRGPITLLVGMESFLHNMINVSICIGNGIGYSRQAVNLAIVRSVISEILLEP